MFDNIKNIKIYYLEMNGNYQINISKINNNLNV